MNRLSLVILLFCIFGGYIADARENHYKVTCSGSKSQTSVDRRHEAKTSEFWILACCPKGMPLTFLNDNAFCCGGRGHCFGNICTCDGNGMSSKYATIATQMSLIKSVS
ncbi:hypothetical protein OS493_015028 [Desmophyllum pertusum]|uniref:Uncharacterized protein n=1 Tax=Desmophyllum pertusum TaxID=174260 RepID=A0A9X0A5P8_9CNID|nr:hypothetical protein OS493_015028 [Desmophyllum pertusum]